MGKGKKGASWKGTGQAQQTRHKWQNWAPQRPRKASKAGEPRLPGGGPWKLRLYILAGLVLLGCLAYLLMNIKRPTELIAFAVTNYPAPAVPNAWAAEDIEALRALSGTISLKDLSPDWQDRKTGAKAWEEALHSSARGNPKRPVILYVSMVGVVNEDGQPCLLPPHTSPLSPVSFITVTSLLDQIDQTLPGRRKLLVLDASQMLDDWEMGVLYNSFHERLEKLLQDRPLANLAVLCSASPGQRSWPAPELQGTAFGRFFTLALGGMADGFLGRANGRVELAELFAFLRQHLEHWSRSNRGSLQSPVLYPADADFRLAFSDTSRSDELADSLRQLPRPTPTIAPEVSAGLWKQFDALRQYDPVHHAPARWSDLEHRLVRMDTYSTAGMAYAGAAQQHLDALTKDISLMANQGLARASSKCFMDRWGTVDQRTGLEGFFGATADRTGGWLSSVPLNEYFGLLSETEVRDVEQVLQKLSSPQGKSTAIQGRDPAARLEAAAWLAAVAEEDVASLWAAPDQIARVLALRRALEDLAIPWNSEIQQGDERPHYLVRTALAPAMAAQRRLEDALFLGESNASDVATQLEKELRERLAVLKQLREDAIESAQVADHTWAELPYLATWFGQAFLEDVGAEAQEARLDEQQEWVRRLVALIDHNRRLVDALRRIEDDPLAEGEPRFLTPKRAVVLERQAIRDEVLARIARVVADPAADAPTYRAIHNALRLPIVPAEQRETLLSLLADVRRRLHDRYLDQLSESEAEEVAGEAGPVANDYLERIADWPQHPIAHLLLPNLHLLEKEVRHATPWERLEAWSGHTRKQLASFGTSYRPVSGELTGDLVQYRQQLVDAEQSLRAAAPLVFKTDADTNPVGALRRLDLQQLLLWHRRQLLEGMWHASWDARQRAFVQVAAEDCARVIRNLRNSRDLMLEEMLNRQLKQQDGLLETRLAAELQADADASTTDEGQIEIHTRVKEVTPGFPVGRAAVYLAKNGKRLAKLVFRDGFAVPYTSSQPEEFILSTEKSAELNGEMTAVVFFRGRRFAKLFHLEPVDGLLVDYVPHRYGPPSITLRGELGKRSAFVFLLDCSKSMGETIPVRQEVGAARVTKLEEAKRHLVAMLHRLAKTEAKIGVKFVGSRVNYYVEPGSPPQRKTNGAWPKPIRADLLPAHDVDTIRPLGQFDSVDANVVEGLSQKLLPFGQSPLYLAVNQAFREFETDVNDRRGIIAITDGENQQYVTPQDSPFAKPKMSNVSRADVKGDVPVHFFDFATNERQQNQEFRSIADATGGTYVSASSGQDLLRKLEKQLELDGYLVVETLSRRPINDVQDGQPLPKQLNETLRFSKEEFTSDRYEILFRNQSMAQVQLEGGEALMLELYDRGGALRIRSVPYPEVTEQFGELFLRGDRKTNIRFDAHRPLRSGRNVQFTVSMQSTQKEYTPRPLETWVEITPVTDDADESPYVFYDTNFAPDKPVPELKWTVNDWPQARRARIQFWCKYGKKTESTRYSLADLLNRPDDFKDYRQVDVGDGVPLRLLVDAADLGGGRIRIYQGGAGAAVRIGFETTSQVRPARVKRRFDNSGRASHELHFSAADWDVLRKNARNTFITVASRDECHDGALRLKDPLEVSVYGEGGLLPVTQ